MKAYLRPGNLDRLTVGNRLRAAGEILAIAQPHQVERFASGEHGAVAGARVIRMRVRDQRFLDRARRIDVEPARLATQAGGCGNQNIFRPHAV
jgi:hypothetical protein